MSLSSGLYKAARVSRDLHAVSTGRVADRVKNRAVGRVAARAGFWSTLWGGKR